VPQFDAIRFHVGISTEATASLQGIHATGHSPQSLTNSVVMHSLALSCIHCSERQQAMQAESPAATADTIAAINQFNDAFNRHDVDGVMALMTDDCVFENTSPAPDGARFEGQVAVRGFWEEFFAGSPHARFDVEDMFAAGDRCTVRWIYHWTNADGTEGHIRGVDVFRVRGDKVAEKLAYVKG
jgi:ketosteroid isomerase-like protein